MSAQLEAESAESAERLPVLELTAQDAVWIDHAADSAVRAWWPERLLEILDVLAAELRRHPETAAAAEVTAAHCAAALARYIGGRVVYLPLGGDLDAAVIRLRIYRAWLGWTGDQARFVDSMIRAHRVSHDTVYAAIREFRARHLALAQGRLF